jgi:hypothetical protein
VSKEIGNSQADGIQDENVEGVGDENLEAQQIDIEKWRFALSVLKESVANAGIKDISEYKGEPLTLRWHVFSQETDKDVILKMLVKGLFGWISADVSLIMTAKWIVDEVESILTQPDATRILDFIEEERAEVLHENARMILTGYISQIPVVAFQILSQALNDAVQSHIKTYVKPLLKEHWQSLGLPKDFTVSPSEAFNNELRGIDEQFKVLRQSFLGNKRVRLTDEKRANLDDEHEQLRSEYQVAKDYYNQSRKAFFAGKRNRTEDEWAEEWSAQSYRIFPTLFYRCLTEINNYQPYELAHIHLADFYGYSAEYIKKLVSQASSLKSKKPQ